jgi:hypothetical protein
MIWRRNSRKTRPAAWLATFAILLQALLPVAHSPAAMAPTGQGDDVIAGLDLALNLCHAPGDNAPDDHVPAPVDHRQCCDFCLAVHAVGGFGPPSAPEIAVAREYGIVLPVVTALVLPARRSILRQQQARAPPVLI